MVAKQQQRKRARKPRKQARKKVYKLEPYERYRTISGAPTAADILALQQAQMAQQSALNTQANLTAERVRQEYETERRRQQQQEQQAQQVGILEALNQRIGQREAEQDNIMQRLDRGERYIAPRFNLIDEYGQRLRALEQQQQEQEHQRMQRYRHYYEDIDDDIDEAASTIAARGQIDDDDDDTTIGGMLQIEDDSTHAQAAAAAAAPIPAPAPAKPTRVTYQPGYDYSSMSDAELIKARRTVQTRKSRGSIEARARAAQVIKEIDAERAKRLNVQVEDEDDNFDT